MKAKMVTGLFRSEPCELSVKDNKLYVYFPHKGKPLMISGIRDVFLSKIPNGTSDIEFSANDGQFRFLLQDVDDEETAMLMFKLTRESSRLELKAQGI